MAKKDKTLLYVGLAGAAGYGLYVYLKNEYYSKVNMAMFPMAPMSQPGFWELLLTSASSKLAQARMFDDMMKLRGKEHYKAWRKAVESGAKTYTFSGACFQTANGSPCV